MKIDYQQFLDDALLNAIKNILTKVQYEGLEGNHFYITFNTEHLGVALSQALKIKYPKEITIVLQNQFSDLKVSNFEFTVKLTFNGIPEKITVPFDSIISFVDPSVNFMLQFNVKKNNENLAKHIVKNISQQENIQQNFNAQDIKNNVIMLDSFRNKKT